MRKINKKQLEDELWDIIWDIIYLIEEHTGIRDILLAQPFLADLDCYMVNDKEEKKIFDELIKMYNLNEEYFPFDTGSSIMTIALWCYLHKGEKK